MNKILVSIVFAVILVLGINKVTDIIFHNPAPQTSAYQVNVANVTSEENQTSSESSQTGDIMTLLASTNAVDGAKVFKKCAACHSITQAGGKLSQELTAEFTDICAQKGIKFYVMYGQTEATARMSYLPWEYARQKLGSMGIAIPGGQFWLEDENGNVIGDIDTMGELIYKGDNVTLGYAENYIDLSKGDENKGILRTGDLAKRDADGFYYITGRKKRFLKMFGKRVNLNEVEELIKAGLVLEGKKIL